MPATAGGFTVELAKSTRSIQIKPGQSILAGIAPQTIRDGKDPATFQGLNPLGTPEAMFTYAVPNLLIDHALRHKAQCG